MKSWNKVKLGTLLTESKVVSEKPSTDKRLRVKLNVLGVKKRPITKDKKGATKYYIRKAGQFIYGKQNLHKGAFGIIPFELDGFESSLDIPAFDINESCYPEWIFYFFKKGNFYSKLETLAKGVGSKRIHPKQIFEFDIYLPSKEEQRKVLDEIEKAEISNQVLIKEIESQKENLTKLRQSILCDAVQGKLTQGWREKNPNLKPASELLNTIKAKKSKLVKEKKIKKIKPLPPIKNEEIPFAIPEGWEWCRFQKIANIASNLVKPNSFLDCPHIAPNSILKNKGVLLDYKTVREDNLISSKHYFYPNQILYSKIRPHLNKLVIVNFEGLCSADMYPIDSFIIIEYLFYFMLSTVFVEQSIKSEGRVAMPKINQTELNKILISIPSLLEQEVIVEKINQLLTNCDILEKETEISKINAEKLMQSVLLELLGEENNKLFNKVTSKKKTKKTSRKTQYNNKTLLMNLVSLLERNGELHAEDLWKMSKYPNDIDAFYAELKEQIEDKKTIKEGEEKGYLKLV